MKYAVYNVERGRIKRVLDTEPQNLLEGVASVECPDDTEVGSFYIDGQFLTREEGREVVREKRKRKRLLEIPLSQLKATKTAELANARYQEEIGGFTINGTGTALDGVFIRTDREVSQSKITQGAITATINPNYITDWQMADGSIVTLDANAIILISTKFSEFEQTGRTKFKNLLAQVQSATTAEELLALQWQPDGTVTVD